MRAGILCIYHILLVLLLKFVCLVDLILLFLPFLFKTVYVSNIPYTTRWGDLKDLFREKVGEILYCEVFEKAGKSLGVGAIEFNTQTDAERAVKIMNKYEMGKFSETHYFF